MGGVQRVGIRVPRVRVLEYTSREWRQAKWAIRSKAEAADPTGVDALKVEKELDRPFIMGTLLYIVPRCVPRVVRVVP
jgi:hypothetical protein